ncbi:MAG: DUF5320 domain-containing protein [Firmicutes bacterium]|nr:DUF5320 domain-containing protein [Bacillota bacterium]
MWRWMMGGFGFGRRAGFGAGFGFGGGRGFGRGFGFGAGWGRGNPYPFCRFNPALPSRRAMAASMYGYPVTMHGYDPAAWAGHGYPPASGYPVAGDAADYSLSEDEYLKSTAEYLQNQLDAIQKQIDSVDSKEKEG